GWLLRTRQFFHPGVKLLADPRRLRGKLMVYPLRCVDDDLFEHRVVHAFHPSVGVLNNSELCFTALAAAPSSYAIVATSSILADPRPQPAPSMGTVAPSPETPPSLPPSPAPLPGKNVSPG